VLPLAFTVSCWREEEGRRGEGRSGLRPSQCVGPQVLIPISLLVSRSPAADTRLTTESYTRSWDEDEQLGLHDMAVGSCGISGGLRGGGAINVFLFFPRGRNQWQALTASWAPMSVLPGHLVLPLFLVYFCCLGWVGETLI
jgi:hypothetical protein